MGAINRIPLGLLSMLESKTGGKNPFQLGETVSPVLDMSPFYHSQSMTQPAIASWTTAVINGGDSVTVPEGKCWFVYGLAVRAVGIAVGDVFDMHVQLIGLPGSGNTITPLHNFGRRVAVQIAERMIEGFSFPVPLPLLPGTDINYVVSTVGGNVITGFGYAWVAEFDI